MKRKIFISGILFAIFSMVLLLGMAFMANSPAAAQPEDQSGLRTIQVSGNGEVSVEPDRAQIRLGVQTEAESAQDALQLNNEQMTSVIDTLTEAGVEETDIRTEVLRVTPMFDDGPEGDRSLTGYRASNIVNITVNNLENIGEVLDAAVSAGGNTIEGIQFEVSNQAEAESVAREAAFSNAQQKAEQLAELAGNELGAVHTIVETGFSSPAPVAFAAEETTAARVPIQPGTQTVQASVQVTWELGGE